MRDNSKIAAIKSANDLVVIVKEHGCKLKRVGGSLRGACPIHHGKNASFSVDVEKGYYKCFGCEAKGDVFNFVQEVHDCNFAESLKYLAERVGMSAETSITAVADKSVPKSAAKMYLEIERKLLDVPDDWYTQETYGYGNKHTATVRFYLSKTVYWERFVDGHLFERNFNIKGKYSGLGWMPKNQKIKANDKVYVCEAIFDAISLAKIGLKVICGLSCGNLPMQIIERHKSVEWIIAFDGDVAGRTAAKKYYKKLSDENYQVSVIDPVNNQDWNSLHKKNQLTDKFIKIYQYRGKRLVAKSAAEKMAWSITEQYNKPEISAINLQIISAWTIAFDNAYYKCELLKQADSDKFAELLKTPDEAAKFLIASIRQTKISNCKADFLYTQYDTMLEEVSYYFRVTVQNSKTIKQAKFHAGAIADQTSFNRALLSRVSRANFYGDIKDFRSLIQRWFAQDELEIRTVPFLGYDKVSKTYLYPDFGYFNGRHIKANKLDFIDTGKDKVKTTFKQWHPVAPQEPADWFRDFYLVGGNNGVTGLAFWLMSLFAVQLRKQHVTVPFWEFTGEAAAGKSTILNFLWKLLGVENHEGRDPNKLRPAAIGRMFLQVSNFPVVLLEGDRDNNSHRAGFDLNHLKTLYDGQNPYGRALFNAGVEIDEPPFYGTIVVSQNDQVSGEEQILSRFVQTIASKTHFTNESLQAARRLEILRHHELVHFLHKSLSLEPKIMATFDKVYPKYLQRLSENDQIKSGRICKNHAQIMAMGKCLQLVVPSFDDLKFKNWCQFMLGKAIKRQQDINADHPLLEIFWDIYDTYNLEHVPITDGFHQLDPKLNHSKNDQKIAINLRRFKELAEIKRQQLDVSSLRKLLPSSKRYKFIGRETVSSGITNKSEHCWVFAKGNKNAD